MLLGKFDTIGEKTINKIAEMAFKSQIKSAKYLSVQVKTNPQQLAKGILESLDIDGNGLIMRENLPLEKMRITLNDIAVSPFKALMGNVELTQPSRGKARIILNETDIETILNVDNLNSKLGQYPTASKVFFKRVDFRILSDGRIAIKAKLKEQNSNKLESICLIIKPRICQHKKGIILDEFACTQGEIWSATVVKILLAEVGKVLNLENLLIDGIYLQVDKISISEGKLNLFANAGITHLPKSKK